MAPGKKRGDITWQHCRPSENDKKRLQCNYCKRTFSGGVFRMKHHLAGTQKNIAPCSKASEVTTEWFRKLLKVNKTDKEDRDERRYHTGRLDSYYGDRDPSTDQGEKGKRKAAVGYVVMSEKKQRTLNESWENGERDTDCEAIARFFYANCIPLNVVKSPYFSSMMEGVSHSGKGLKLPSYHELQNKYLDKEVKKINALMDIQKKEWKKGGCTIMSHGWTDGAHRSVMNFLVNSIGGTYFLRSEDISSISHSAENLFELFDSVVEEVGEEHVVQFVTDSASGNVKAGELLMQKRKKLFWSPCATHLLDLMLSDIGKLPLHAETTSKAAIISRYIYQHHWVLDLMREYTQNRELVWPTSTRFATRYLNLNSIREQRAGLSAMFTSKEWESSSYSKKEDGSEVRDIVSDISFWHNIDYCMRCVAPFVNVLRLLDSKDKPTMPYVNEMMDRVKEAVAKNMANDEKFYRPIWDIVNLRLNLLLRYPLYAASCYLNPAFHYEESFKTDNEVKEGLCDFLERLCPTSEERVVIDEQLERFKKAKGSFGREMAMVTRKTKRPDLWWESYGWSCPELQMLAIRVLSQTCSASGSEHSWNTFEMIHSVKRNRLEQHCLNALVYVKYNLNLQEQQKMREAKRGLDPICLSAITEKGSPTLPEDPSCLNVETRKKKTLLSMERVASCSEGDRHIESPWAGTPPFSLERGATLPEDPSCLNMETSKKKTLISMERVASCSEGDRHIECSWVGELVPLERDATVPEYSSLFHLNVPEFSTTELSRILGLIRDDDAAPHQEVTTG